MDTIEAKQNYAGDIFAASPFIMQTSSAKLQQRSLQENPSYTELVDLGMAQEQARRKATKLPDGETEAVSRLKDENKRLKDRLKKADDGDKFKKKCP